MKLSLHLKLFLSFGVLIFVDYHVYKLVKIDLPILLQLSIQKRINSKRRNLFFRHYLWIRVFIIDPQDATTTYKIYDQLV